MRLSLGKHGRALVILSATFVVLMAAGPRAHAAPELAISVSDFSGEASEAFTISGDAGLDESRIRLTRAKGTLAGSAMYSEPIELGKDYSFSAYFTFSMTPFGDPGARYADGIAFILHNDKKKLGAIGDGIGYQGIKPSLVVEFDTFENGEHGDPDSNHIGINVNGEIRSISTVSAPVALSDSATRHAWVEYDGQKNLLEVRVATSSVRPSKAALSQTINLTGLLTSPPYVGFTAGTGKYSEEHHIESFYFAASYLKDGIDPRTE